MPEIPSRIDFSDPAQARAWVDDTVARRPWRPRFFDAFRDALNAAFDAPVRVAELGSGPGHLARAVLSGCRIEAYKALDLSPAMHAIAREHLGALAARVEFVVADFRDEGWPARVGPVDALLTMQAAHEVRHRSHLPALLRRAHAAIRPGGLLLFCDHHAEPGSGPLADLFVARREQPRLLTDAGFTDVTPLLDEGGMALHRARRA